MDTRNVTIKLAVGALALTLAACTSYVRRADYDVTLAELRQNDRELRADVDELQAQMSQLSRELQTRFERYDAAIADLGGRVRVDMTAHFEFDDATLREEDRPALDDFARVIRDHPGEVLITVEGFTDPAGPAGYNQRLGQRRAEAVRDYLVSNGGLAANRVRAVSYGESQERQVIPGAAGDGGMANRRVALVIDYVGSDRVAG